MSDNGYVVACGHKAYSDTLYCAEMSCGNYYMKRDVRVNDTQALAEFLKLTAHKLVTAEVHTGLRGIDRMDEDEIRERVEHAQLCASRVIEMSGYDPGDSDRRGVAMDETVMELLTAAILLIGPDEFREGVVD